MNSQKKKNPKKHDSLFKWLIKTFCKELFEHYFPNINVKIGKDPFLDKEFINIWLEKFIRQLKK